VSLPQDNWQPADTPDRFHRDCLSALEAAGSLLDQARRDAPLDPFSLRIFAGCTRVLAKTPASVYRPFALLHKPSGIEFGDRLWPSFHHAAVWNCEQSLVDLETGIAGLGRNGMLRAMPLLDFVARVVDQPECVQGLRLHEFAVVALRERCAIEASWLASEGYDAAVASSTPAVDRAISLPAVADGSVTDAGPRVVLSNAAVPSPSVKPRNGRVKAAFHAPMRYDQSDTPSVHSLARSASWDTHWIPAPRAPTAICIVGCNTPLRPIDIGLWLFERNTAKSILSATRTR